MLHFDVIGAELLPIAVATLASTVAVLVLTGWTHTAIEAKTMNAFLNSPVFAIAMTVGVYGLAVACQRRTPNRLAQSDSDGQ